MSKDNDPGDYKAANQPIDWFKAGHEAGASMARTHRGEPPVTYAEIIARCNDDAAFREGLLSAAAVARAQGTDPTMPPCPSGMVAVYLESLAAGELP